MTNERLQHPIKKVMIWPNTGKEGMGLAVRQAADVLREFGAEVILAERALEIGIDTGGFLVHTLQKAMIEADFIVVLGGDGTILSMAQHAAPYHVPIFGVNMGHVGFMTEVEFPEFRMIQRIFEGKYTIDDRIFSVIGSPCAPCTATVSSLPRRRAVRHIPWRPVARLSSRLRKTSRLCRFARTR